MKAHISFPLFTKDTRHRPTGLLVAAMCTLITLIPSSLYAQTAQETAIADTPPDTARVPLTASLLTCAPGDESYELYGHTALRIRSNGEDEDIVYNYGYFNFKRPHFVWHFILGETDYSLRPMTWDHFYSLYTQEGRWIDEQVLNLTPSEVSQLAIALEANRWEAMQNGWTYRYNYLTDNCTTRAIDQIRSALHGTLILPDVEVSTYRKALHKYTGGHPWAQMGNDMLLGAGCDNSIEAEAQLFLPIEAETLLQEARVKAKDGTVRPLVKSRNRIAPLPDKPADTSWPPMVWAIVLLLTTIVTTACEWRKKKALWPYDVLLLTLQGAAGCIIAFMLCFSSHPTVDSNLLISWLNPLPLFFLWPVARCFRAQQTSRFFILQVAMTGIFFVLALLHLQQFPPETYVLALSLLTRAIWTLYRPKAKV